MISLILLISFLSSGPVTEQPFKPFYISMAEVDSGRVWFEYDRNVSREKAIQIFFHLKSNEERGRKLCIYKVPNTETYLCSVDGTQLVQLACDSAGIHELFRSSEIEWSWILNPSFYVHDSSTVVIGEFGEEHMEGFLVLQADNGWLKQLDRCDLVPLDSLGDYASPSDHIRVQESGGVLHLVFATDIVTGVLTNKESTLHRERNKSIMFRYSGVHFVRVQ